MTSSMGVEVPSPHKQPLLEGTTNESDAESGSIETRAECNTGLFFERVCLTPRLRKASSREKAARLYCCVHIAHW